MGSRFSGLVVVLLSLLLVNGVFAGTLTTFTNSTALMNASFPNEAGGIDPSPSITMPWKSSVSSAVATARGETLNIVEPPALEGGSAGSLSSNHGIFVRDNKMYVVDDGRHRVLAYTVSESGGSTSYTLDFQIGITDTAGNNDTTLDNPKDVYVNDSAIFVSDHDNHRLNVYNLTGAFLYQIAGSGSGSGDDKLFNPIGLEVDSNYVYVADSQNNRIQIFWHNGTYFHTISGLSTPTDIAKDSGGTFIYIVNSGRQTVDIYTSSFDYASKRIGTLDTSGLGERFNNPRAVDVSSTHVYVADTNNHRVAIWGINTSTVPYIYSYIAEIGVGGVAASTTNVSTSEVIKFKNPRGVVVNGSFVYVSDSDMNRVLKTKSSYPSNIIMKAVYSPSRTDNDWTYSGNLSSSQSATFNSSALTNYLDNCPQVDGFCTYNIEISSASGGVVYLENLNITYEPIAQSRVNGTLGSFGADFNFSKNEAAKTTASVSPGSAYDFYISQGSYNLTITNVRTSQAFGHSYRFENVILNKSSYINNISFQSPGTGGFSMTDRQPILLANVSLGSIIPQWMTLNFSWSGTSVSDPNKVALYKCTSYDTIGNTCRVSWTRLFDVVKNSDGSYISYNTTTPAAMYALVVENLEQMYLNVTRSASSYVCSDTLGLSGSVNSSSGTLVSGAKVYLNITNSTSSPVTSSTATTLSNGSYGFTVILPSSVQSSSGGDTYNIILTAESVGYVNGSVSTNFVITCCSPSYIGLCDNEVICAENNGYWCDDNCQSVACGTPCASTTCSGCSNETACSGASCYWCNSACQSSACGQEGCSSQTLGGCITQDACSLAGGVYFSGKCYSAEEKCSALYLGLCESESECNTAGGEWCGTVCRSLCASAGLVQIDANETITGEGNFSFKVSVSNQYSVNMTNTSVVVHGVNSSWVAVVPFNITLIPGESRDFLIQIILPENDSINNYDLSYSIVSDVGDRRVESSLTDIKPTISLPPKIFTTFVILNDLVTAGNRVNFRVQLLNARDEPAVVNITYRIKKGNNTVASKSETLILEEELNFAQTMQVPVTTLQGTYTLEVAAGFTRGSDVEEHSFNVQLPRPWFIFIMILGLGLLVIVYALKFRGRLKKVGEIEEAYEEIDWRKLSKK